MRIHSALEICSRDFMQSFDFCFTVTVTLCAGDVDSGVLKQRNNLAPMKLFVLNFEATIEKLHIQGQEKGKNRI